MPDYFVAEDTTLFTTYYQEIVAKGLVAQFAFEFTDNNRARYVKYDSANDILKQLRKDHVIQQFINYCDSKGVKRRNNMILRSQKLIEDAVHGSIIYNLLDMNEYLQFINKDDATVKRAIELFNERLTTPKLPEDGEKATKKTAFANPYPVVRSRRSA